MENWRYCLLLEIARHLVQALIHLDFRKLQHLPDGPTVLGNRLFGIAIAQFFEHVRATLIGGEVRGHTELLGFELVTMLVCQVVDVLQQLVLIHILVNPGATCPCHKWSTSCREMVVQREDREPQAQ